VAQATPRRPTARAAVRPCWRTRRFARLHLRDPRTRAFYKQAAGPRRRLNPATLRQSMRRRLLVSTPMQGVGDNRAVPGDPILQHPGWPQVSRETEPLDGAKVSERLGTP